jgi:ribosomal protein S25
MLGQELCREEEQTKELLEKSGAEPQKVIWLITENNLAKILQQRNAYRILSVYTVKNHGKIRVFNILSNLNDIIVNDINKKSLFIQLKRKFFR